MYIPFPCTQAPGKIPILTSIPSRRRVGSPAVMAGQPRPTSDAGPSMGSPRVNLRRWPAWARLQRGCAAVAGGGGRGGLLLRRGRRNAGQRATVQASTGSQEELRTVGKHGVEAEGKFTEQPSMAGGSAMARARGGQCLNRAARGRVTSETEMPSGTTLLGLRAYGEGADRLADRATRPGRCTARVTGGAWREGKNHGASGRGVWGKRAWIWAACGLGVRGGADAKAAGARRNARARARRRGADAL
jgi:hypothetical protein